MRVIDASAVLEVLFKTPAGLAIERQVLTSGQTLHAPHLIDLEVIQVLRRYVIRREVHADRGHEALTDFAELPIRRYPHGPLLSRIWELRNNLTAYDAAYVALAEALDVPLVTRDSGIANSVGHSVAIERV